MSKEWKVALLSDEAGSQGSKEAEDEDDLTKQEEEARAQGEIFWREEEHEPDEHDNSHSPAAVPKSAISESADSDSPRSNPIAPFANQPQTGGRGRGGEVRTLNESPPSAEREGEGGSRREERAESGEREGRGTPNPFFETPRIASTLSVFPTGSEGGRLLVSGGFAAEDLWESSEENALGQQQAPRLVQQHSHPHLFPHLRPLRPPGLVAAVLIFLFGFAFPPLWLLAVHYLSSPSKKVRRLARASLLALILLCAVLLVFLFHRNPGIFSW